MDHLADPHAGTVYGIRPHRHRISAADVDRIGDVSDLGREYLAELIGPDVETAPRRRAPSDQEDPLYGEYCELHGEEMQDHECPDGPS